MPLVPILRALFPWYAVMAAGVVLFILTEWLGHSMLGSSGQSALGAASGCVAALGLIMRLHEVHHPGEIWRPAQSQHFAKAAKTAGALAGVSGVLDNVLRSSHSHYQWVTLVLTGCLAAAAAALARMAKSNPAEESTSWKH
jgi:hypothetical protein